MAEWTQISAVPDDGEPQVIHYTTSLDSSDEGQWAELQQHILQPLAALQEDGGLNNEVQPDWTVTSSVLGHHHGFAFQARITHMIALVRPLEKHVHVVLTKLQPPSGETS